MFCKCIIRVVVVIVVFVVIVFIVLVCIKVEEGEDVVLVFFEKDIWLIIQVNFGGGFDFLLCVFVMELEKIFGVSVILENMFGVVGVFVMEYVGLQDLDGYVIGFVLVEIVMLNIMQSVDVLLEDYDLFGQIMFVFGVIMVGVNSGIEIFDDFVIQVKVGVVMVVNFGVGFIWEVVILGFGEVIDVEFILVFYDGGVMVVVVVVFGEIVVVVFGFGEVFVQGDVVCIFVVMNDECYFDVEDVEMVEEVIGEEVVFGGWGGIYVFVGLFDDVKFMLEDVVKEVVEFDSYQKFQVDVGNLVVYCDFVEWIGYVEDQFVLFQDFLG